MLLFRISMASLQIDMQKLVDKKIDLLATKIHQNLRYEVLSHHLSDDILNFGLGSVQP